MNAGSFKLQLPNTIGTWPIVDGLRPSGMDEFRVSGFSLPRKWASCCGGSVRCGLLIYRFAVVLDLTTRLMFEWTSSKRINAA
jgi:hypothetical protein